MVLRDKDLATFIDVTSKRWGVTGVAVSFVDGQSHGYSASPSKGPVDPAETRFRICSNTKLFTAVALGILVDQGKLAWSDKVKDRIPGFKWTNAHTNENLSIENLLCHVSGRLSCNQNWQNTYESRHADFVDSTSQQRCYAELGQRFAYDNQTFTLAGHLIHMVSGTLYADFVSRNILEPLGMSKSGFDGRVLLEHGATPIISLDNGTVIQELLPFAPELDSDNAIMAMGGIVSTSDDLAKWLAYLQRVIASTLKQGEPCIISKAGLLEVLRPKTTSDLFGPISCSQGKSPFAEISSPMYGSGCQRFTICGIDVVAHTGSFAGFANITLWTPRTDFGIVILTNTSRRGYALSLIVALKGLEKHFGLPEIDWDSRLRAMPDCFQTGPPLFPRLASGAKARLEREELDVLNICGTYKAPGHGILHIFETSIEEEALAPAASELLRTLAAAEHLGRPWKHLGQPVALAVWDANVLFTKFFKIYRISGNTYAAEGYIVLDSVERGRVQVVPGKAIYGSGAVILHFEEQDGELTCELDTTWSPSQSLQVKTVGQGDITLIKL